MAFNTNKMTSLLYQQISESKMVITYTVLHLWLSFHVGFSVQGSAARVGKLTGETVYYYILLEISIYPTQLTLHSVICFFDLLVLRIQILILQSEQAKWHDAYN